LFAIEAGNSATVFQDRLQKVCEETKSPLPVTILNVWLGKSDERNIDWSELPEKDAAKLHFLLAMRCRNEGQQKEALSHFRKGIKRGDWHAFNQRGLDAVNGKRFPHKFSVYHAKMYELFLDLYRVMSLESENALQQGLIELVAEWENILDDAPQKELPLRALALVQQLLRDFKAGHNGG